MARPPGPSRAMGRYNGLWKHALVEWRAGRIAGAVFPRCHRINARLVEHALPIRKSRGEVPSVLEGW
jgi:hypothetical protein